MSLAVLADHMASKGRGPDSMLIHMSPREVQGLQALAVKNGGSLTVNPDTGLPEAGFLDKLLPSIIGAGVSYFSGGAINPAMIGLGIGAVETARTGDLGRGISAGLGAYGGAGLSEGLLGAGTGALSAEAGSAALSKAGLTGEAALTSQADQVASRAVGDRLASATPFDKMSAGFDAAKANPSSLLTKDNLKYIGSAAAPILADQAIKSGMPTTTTRPGRMSTYSFDPYGQRYTPTGSYEVPRKTEEAAGGGLMGMNDGGYSPGQLNFAERSEPVVRMADGGVPPPPKTVGELYTSILGRAPDPGGLAFWEKQFGTDAPLDPSEINAFTQSANAELANRTPAEQQALAPNLVSAPTPGSISGQPVPAAPIAPAAPITAGLDTLYQENLYRAPDEGGLAYWSKQFGDTIDDKERATFMQAAKPEQQVGDIYRNVLGRDPDPSGLAYWTSQINAGMPPSKVYEAFLTSARSPENAELVNADQIKNATFEQATTPYTGYRSANQTNIVDEWVRNTLGREPTAADKEQKWYKDAATAMTTAPEAKNLYGQFIDYAKTDAAATTAQKIKDATASLAARGVTEADVLRQTGKTIAQLAASDIDFTKNLVGASQLRAPGTKAGFDFSSIRAATTPQTNAPVGTTNPYGNATNPGDITRNADGSTTVTPNIPGRPYGGFSGMEQVRNAYTDGGGSLGYTSKAPKTMEEFNQLYNKQTGGSKQAYDYLMGKSDYSATPYTSTGELMKPYAEAVLGAAPNIASKKVLFDPATRTYKVNPDYIPVTYTPEGKKVIGVSDREVKDKLTGTTAATGGLLSLAGGGSAMSNTADYGQWLKDNNVSIEQIARALGISVAEAKKRYETKGGAGSADMSLGEPMLDSGRDNNAHTVSDFIAKESFEDQAKRSATLDRGLTNLTKLSPTNMVFSALNTLFGEQAPAPVSYAGTDLANKQAAEGQNFVNMQYMQNALMDDTDALNAAVAAQQDAQQQAVNQALNDMSGRQESQMNAGPDVGGGQASSSGISSDGQGGYGGTAGSNGPGDGTSSDYARGGLSALAQGGMSNLGDYSDGGRLLRGPGDGVSDSIPATIGKKRPARLADGEFVVPARIVSELGNGSTEAGARKLYAMMDRIQAARRSSIGKGKVAKNSRADKYLPA